MPLMTWTEKLSVGVAVLDDDHKKLVNMVNELHDGLRAGKGKDVLGEILAGLVSYTQFHFKREEQLFSSTAYLAAAAHKKEHDDLTKQVLDVQTRFRNDDGSCLSIDVMTFLKNWLVKHIQGSDMKYSPHMNARGIY